MTTCVETIETIDESIRVLEPDVYQVILHNDNHTTFDFVIAVLTAIFHHSVEDAVTCANDVHLTGSGVAGTNYTREVAEEKASETIEFARRNGFPLKATFEAI